MNLNRRNLMLSGTAAMAAGCWPIGARAQAGQVMVGTWGGDYGNLLRDNVDTKGAANLGLEVVQDIGTPDPRRTKIIADKQRRQASMDVAFFNDTDAYLLSQQGLLAEIDETVVPRVSQVLPQLRKAYAVPHIYSYQVILYNPEKVDPAPKSFADFWNPQWRGRVGFVDDMYRQVTIAAALSGGGGADNFDPAWDRLLELRALEARVYPSNEALAADIKSGEIWLTTLYLARGYMWKEAGLPLKHVVASEGAPVVAFEAVVPRNSGNLEGAMKYLNSILDPQSQIAFSDKMGYQPTVQDAVLPGHLASQISLSAEDQGRLIVPNYAYSLENNARVLDFWTRQFKA